MTAPFLQMENISKSFATNGNRIDVLQNVSLRASDGEFLSIIGKSGCGKSTLLKILAGFIPATTGRILLHGTAITRPGADRCVVFQEDALFPWLTVAENIGFGLKAASATAKERNREIDRFLDLVGLRPFRDYLPSEISGGMKQRVALARVLILRPKILLMDEPFAALDAQTREKMQDLLLALWRQFSHTIIFVTHDVREALTLGDRVLMMQAHPGMIAGEASIQLERPRRQESPQFHQYCRKLYDFLASEP